MNTKHVLLACSIILLLSFSHGPIAKLFPTQAAPSPSSDAWVTETVVDGPVNPSSSLALDSAGNPHISYSASGDLKYARWTGNDWAIQTVDSGGQVGWDSSLALDSADVPHISYSVPGILKYASWTGNTWDIQIVDEEDDVANPSLALDASGNPHISYADYYYWAGVSLKYARWTGSSWSIEIVDGEGGSGSSLALEEDGTPHISYHDYSHRELRYARRTGTAWDIEMVDGQKGIQVPGVDTSLALDEIGTPHISYYEWNDSALKYARWTGTAWDIQFVESEELMRTGGSLALDKTGIPHISYYDRSKGNLKYARRTGSTWLIQTVDSEDGDASSSSLALSAAGYPHISYHSYINGLKYAHLLSPLTLNKESSSLDGIRVGGTLTYTLTLYGPNLSTRLWDPLPDSVEFVPGSISGTITPTAVYSPTASAVVWQGTLAAETAQTVRFQVTPTLTATESLSLSVPIVNTAWLTDTENSRSVSSTVIVNARHTYLPLIARDN